MKFTFGIRKFFDHIIVQIISLILVVFILLFFLFDNIIMPLYTRQGSERPVPNLVGLSLEQASDSAQTYGFGVTEEPAKFDAFAAEGNIIEQNPHANSYSKPGRKIHIVPALGIQTDFAPELIGLGLRDAQVQCKNYGLNCGSTDVRYLFSEYMPKGNVISKNPAAGSEVSPGQVMELVISLGPEPVKFIVPSLVEQTLHDARQSLIEAGLELGQVNRKATNVYVAGTVIAQSLRTGERVERGTHIDVVVAIPQQGEDNVIENDGPQ